MTSDFASLIAAEIVQRYRNLCAAHNCEPAQTYTLEDWISDALRQVVTKRWGKERNDDMKTMLAVGAVVSSPAWIWAAAMLVAHFCI